MTILHFDAMPAAAAQLPELSLSGGFATATGFRNASGGFKFDNLGRAFRIQNGANTQINIDTDWITSTTVYDPADYEIRWHETSVFFEDGGISTLTQHPSAGWDEDTFLDLSATRRIEYNAFVNSGPGEPDTIWGWAEIVLLFEIRYQDGSNTLRNPLTSTIDAANIAEAGTFYHISLHPY